jgi:GNAT superfamily N-acetyltransferase
MASGMSVQPNEDATFTLRLATLDDVHALESLIAESVRVLQAPDYSTEQREAALGTVFGVDTQLIRDGTYFVIETATEIVACGGWSRRRTLFGSDQQAGREDVLLNPNTEAARIRAFFVRPRWERRGLGTRIMQACESAARAEGFHRLQLGSTLTGVALYRSQGFIAEREIEATLPGGLKLPVVLMSKILG